MTEKLLTSPSLTPLPSPTSRKPWGWGQYVKSQLFFQNSINTYQERHLYRDMLGSRIFCQGRGCRLLNLFYSIYTEGSNGFTTHFPRGSNFFQGGGVQILISIETHITITCDFPGDSLSPPLDPHMGNVEFGTDLCCLLLSLETPNANRSIVFKQLANALIRLRIGAGWS